MDARRAGLSRIAGTVVLSVALAACAGTQDEPAGSAARDFLAAIRDGDGAKACDLMAPAARAELEDSTGKPCPEAVLDEDLEPATSLTSVQVYDKMAQVLVGSETLFLSRFDGDWLVVAAACTPKPGDQPYDCSIQVS